MISVYSDVESAWVESVTVTSTVNVPAEVGCPEMVAMGALGLLVRVSPGGRPVAVNVRGAFAPTALMTWK
jgi:hypothetical protein